MYIKNIGINHLKEVAALEKEVYPEELCLGYEDYVQDFKSVVPYHNASLGVFVDGQLKAYIICYRKKGSTDYYVSDLVCLNPRLLLPLLLVFGERVDNRTLTAEFRYTSYRMITHIIKKYPTVIQVKKQNKVESYYSNGEDMYSMTFKVKMNNIHSIPNKKYLILKEIYSKEVFQINFKEVMYHLYFTYGMSSEEISKYKSFILKHIHYRNLDALKMLGDTFRFIVHHGNIFKHEKAYANMKEYLLSKGYTERNDEEDDDNIESYRDKIWMNDRYRRLNWTTVGELDTKFKEDTISYYRSHVKRKFINYYKKKKFVTEIQIFDKYGDTWLQVSPQSHVYSLFPRNFSNLFDAQLKKLQFIKDIKEKVEEVYDGYSYDVYFLVDSSGIPAIRKYVGEEVAYAYLNKVLEMAQNSENKRDIFHDWGYIIPEIISFKEYLTKGALKHIFLNKSLNQINKIKTALSGLQIDNSKYLDKKALRKSISKAIRKDEDISPIVSAAVHEAEKRWLKNKRISKKVFEDMMVFVDRMKRYSPQISVNMLFRYFGQKTVDMVKGKYEGFFQAKTIDMDYQEFGQFILENMKERTRRTKRLYSALNKIQDIDDIFNGKISTENFDIIMAELKQRNIQVPEEFMNLNKFHAKVEQKCSPEYLIAGDASVCCMSFGQEKAVTYALEKGFGIINVYYKDRVVANSVIWVNEPYNCLVLDNIEVHPNYKKFNHAIEKLFGKTVHYLLDAYQLDYAVQGRNYNDLELFEQGTQGIRMEELKPVDVKAEYFYTDARYVCPLSFKITAEEAAQRIKSVNAFLKEERKKERKQQRTIDMNIHRDEMDLNFDIMELAI